LAKLQYLDKRDDREVLLRYSAHELAFDAASRALDLIRSNEIHSILVSEIPQKYVDVYYQKMIYEAFLPLAHQLVIYRHDKQNSGNVPINAINANNFPSPALLKKIWPQNEIYFSSSISSQFQTYVKKGIKDLLINNKRLINLLHPSVSHVESHGGTKKIAINYVAGFDPNKRSDIVWFENSGIDSSSLIVYYENPYMMIRHDDKQTAQEFFTKLGVKQIKLWQWNTSNGKSTFDKLKHRLESSQRLFNIDKWMCSTAVQLCKRSSFWRGFFDNNNVRIHLDPIESGLETIIKQIALHSIGGLSIGNIKSYPTINKGEFVGHYPNDVFFSWGREDAKKISLTNEHIENILVSGFPFAITKKNPDSEPVSIERKLKSNNTKFNVLLIDSNHGQNDGLDQLIGRSTMIRFYQLFLDWVLEDEDIGLIIKPKKSESLLNLPEIIAQFEKVKKNTSRCYLVKNSFQKMPSSYLKGVDMVVGTGTFFPSSVIECAINSTKGIIYDYPNLRYYETNLYAWGENKVIFSDIDVMISTLKAYKNDSSTNPNLGDWSTNIDELDPFRDNKGGERIGAYMRWLLENFNKGKNRGETINNANKLFADAWGKDKVIGGMREN
jgi:hypothetical protein